MPQYSAVTFGRELTKLAGFGLDALYVAHGVLEFLGSWVVGRRICDSVYPTALPNLVVRHALDFLHRRQQYWVGYRNDVSEVDGKPFRPF